MDNEERSIKKSKVYFRYRIDFLDVNFRDYESEDTNAVIPYNKHECSKFLKLLRIKEMKFHRKFKEDHAHYGINTNWYNLMDENDHCFAALSVELQYHYKIVSKNGIESFSRD